MSATVVVPAVKRKQKHRLLNRVQTLVYKLVFAHIGKFAIVAVYYILTQWLHGQYVKIGHTRLHLWNVKYTWDHAFTATTSHGGVINLMSQATWTPMRHILFRGVLEGVLGVVLFNQIGFNVERYRKKLDPEPSRFDRLILRSKVIASPYQDHPVTGAQYAFLPVIIVGITLIVGLPLYLGIHSGLARAAHWSWLEPKISSHPSLWQKLYVGDYDGLIVGIVAGFVSLRAYRAYLFANAMNGARGWVAKGRGPKWWMPVHTRNLVADLCQEGVARQQAKLAERNDSAVLVAIIGALVFFALALYGYYILQFIA